MDARRNYIEKIKSAVEKGSSFEQACASVDIEDIGFKEAVVNDSLMALIADMHISGGVPLKRLALRLRLSLSHLLNAKESLMRESG